VCRIEHIIKATLVFHGLLVQIWYCCYLFYCCEERVLTLAEEHMLRVLRKTFGPRREEVGGDCMGVGGRK
jgi:hypothetical protein